MTTQYLDGIGATDGTILGQDSSVLVSFYGATPVNQPDNITNVATAVSVISTSSSHWAYASSAQANAIVTAVNSLIDNAEELGLSAAS